MEVRQYAAANSTRLTSDWAAFSTSADTEVYNSLRLLRNRARQLCRDFSYANSAVRNLALRIVGHEVKFQSQISDGQKLSLEVNFQVEKLFEAWGRTCDVRGAHTFQDLLFICALSVIRDGELFIRLVKRKSTRSPVPLQLELIEADQCPEWLNSNTPSTGGFTRMGIEYDSWRSPIRYAFLPYHPGDTLINYRGNMRQVQWVPANEVIHLYFPDRVGQGRGVTALASLANELRHLAGYQEAELIKARGQAAIAGFVKSEDAAIESSVSSDGTPREEDLSPGTIKYLLPGEEFQGFNPSSPNPTYPDFVKQLLKAMAGGMGLPYHTFSADPSESNYSSSRLASLDNVPFYKRLQAKFGAGLLTPLYEAWLERAVVANAISVPGYFQAGFYPEHYWQFPGTPFIDPEGELRATELALKLGLTTVTNEVATRGGDIEDLIATRVAEVEKLAKIKEAEAKFGVQPAGADADGAAAVQAQPFTGPAKGLTATGRSLDLTPVVGFWSQRAKKCVKGFSCGDSCQAKGKVCRKNLSSQQLKEYDQLTKQTKTKKGDLPENHQKLADLIKASEKPSEGEAPKTEPKPKAAAKPSPSAKARADAKAKAEANAKAKAKADADAKAKAKAEAEAEAKAKAEADKAKAAAKAKSQPKPETENKSAEKPPLTFASKLSSMTAKDLDEVKKLAKNSDDFESIVNAIEKGGNVVALRNNNGEIIGAASVRSGRASDVFTVNTFATTNSRHDKEFMALLVFGAAKSDRSQLQLMIDEGEIPRYKKLGFDVAVKNFGLATIKMNEGVVAQVLEKNKKLFDSPEETAKLAASFRNKAEIKAAKEKEAQEKEFATYTALNPVRPPSQSSRSQLFEESVVSSFTNHSRKGLDQAIDKIIQNDPEAAERFGDFRQFVNSRELQIVFTNNEKASRLIGKIKDTEFVNDPDTFKPDQSKRDRVLQSIQPTAGQGGFTAGRFRHVVINSGGQDLSSFSKGDFDDQVDRVIREHRSRKYKEWAVSNDDGGMASELTNVLHEVGHQIHASARDVEPPPKMKRLTRYGETNKHETFAEAYAFYMVAGKKYQEVDPIGYDWVHGIVKNSIR